MAGQGEDVVLCGSNSYERKYYFNEEFANLPEAVKRELQVMCVWFTEECGGILTLEFDEDGTLEFKHATSEYDGYYDEIGADLKIKQYREERRELLEALELYYKTMALGLELDGDLKQDMGASEKPSGTDGSAEASGKDKQEEEM